MKAKGVLAIGTAAVSFAIVVGMSLADTPQCTGVTTNCPGWGAENPQVQGFCCIAQWAAYASCGTGAKSVTQNADECGVLQAIVDGTCSGAMQNGYYCGGAYCGTIGCISANCPN